MATTQIIEKCQPYRLHMACGHFEIRMMRESTAGVPFEPTMAIEVRSSACAECEPSKADLREHQRTVNEQYRICYQCGQPADDQCPLCKKLVCRLCAEREGEVCCDAEARP